ncbi:serine hydrolase FSH [Lipomyces japonicus]|uniref:serine hydrolase FSH n=1 Tax=Lipomyces japonicus TaxID=56871 RepID=UPI0034CF961E
MGKVLLLHGFTQSGDLFSKKTGALRKGLLKLGFTSAYPTAPIKLAVPDSSDPFERASLQGAGIGEDSFAWWTKDDVVNDYVGMDDSFTFLTEYIAKEGPFDGVIGFSQGAALAGVLTTQIRTLLPSHPEFKFAVLYSGYASPLPQHQKYYDPLISTPSLHVIGSLDTIVAEPRSLQLYDAAEPSTRELYRHPGGHFVPSQKEQLNAVLGWIQNAVERAEAVDNDAIGDNDDDDGWESDFDEIGGK